MYITHPDIYQTTSDSETLNKIVNVQIEKYRRQPIPLLNTKLGKEIFIKETIYVYTIFCQWAFLYQWRLHASINPVFPASEYC